MTPGRSRRWSKSGRSKKGFACGTTYTGVYPSMVEIPRTGDAIDITVTRTPFADIQHAVCWTSNYLAGLSCKYAFLKASNAAENGLPVAEERESYASINHSSN